MPQKVTLRRCEIGTVEISSGWDVVERIAPFLATVGSKAAVFEAALTQT
jgi:hypothetical protein